MCIVNFVLKGDCMKIKNIAVFVVIAILAVAVVMVMAFGDDPKPTGTTSVAQTSSVDTSSEDSSEETSSEDASSEETSSAEASSKEESSKATSSKETSSKETSSKATSSTSNEPTYDGTISVARIDNSKMQALYQRNKDTVGWIKIPNTNIDYGVVKENYSGEYMNLDYDKKYYKDGDAIWADAWNTFGTRNQLSKNTIIYGHNWTNYKRPIQVGRASDKHFSQLAAYDYINFARSNPYISFSTLEEEMYWQIFAVFYVEVPDNYSGSTDYYYINDNPDSLVEFTNEAMERSMFDFGVTISENDKILTLSTCTRVYNTQALAAGRRKDQQRFVIMAKLMPKGAELKPMNITVNKDMKEPQF